jgi:hypothetical protein
MWFVINGIVQDTMTLSKRVGDVAQKVCELT